MFYKFDKFILYMYGLLKQIIFKYSMYFSVCTTEFSA